MTFVTFICLFLQFMPLCIKVPFTYYVNRDEGGREGGREGGSSEIPMFPLLQFKCHRYTS